MESSLFTLEKSRIDYNAIKSFCDQQISEGLRVEYKGGVPENEELARTICAFANTAGGILLIGVEADKVRNIPTDIPGIKVAKGLEEKVLNICSSHILPAVATEIKLCPYELNNGEKRAVLFIRVGQSPSSPHYVWQTREILMRVGCKNERADLRSIESLIERRNKIRDVVAARGSTVWYQKIITTEVKVFETVVVEFPFAEENAVLFNKEKR